MAKCRNDIFMHNIGVKKLTKQTEVHFDVQRNLPDCKKITASKYVSVASETARYNRYKIPTNQFECLRSGCVNSGTLYNEGAETVYRIQEDATEFSAGVITFYVLAPEGESTAVVKLSNTADFTDAWQYEVNLADMSKGKDGFTAVVVDLTKEPTVVGEGWTPEEIGAYLSIAINGEEGADMSGVGISSIGIFDDMTDFETSTHVILSCLTGIDGSFELEAAEATCHGDGGYNTDELTGFEKTITARALTPNFMILNPLAKKGEAVTGFDNVTIEKTVEALADTEYGYITIPDMAQDECGFFSAALADSCNITDAQLDRLSIPSRVDLDEKHYQLIDNGDGSTTVLFNAEHIDAPILISYPKTAEVEEWVFAEDAIGDTRVRLSYVKCQTDGVRYRYVFNNVLITSFPDALTEEETEFEFTVNIQKDSKGNFGYAYRILD